MRMIDADALIEKCGGWYVEEGTESGFIGTLKNLLATEPTIQPVETDINVGDKICRQAAIDALMERFKRVPTNAIIAKDVIEKLPSVQSEKQHGRIFQEIVVEYPSYHTYPEYKGKPYFSIKYTESGQEFIGYGTYKPEVLSKYLKEYFMPSAQPERKKGRWIPQDHNKVNGMTSTAVYYYPKCSVCGHCANYTNFCPNCGADMRGERNE